MRLSLAWAAAICGLFALFTSRSSAQTITSAVLFSTDANGISDKHDRTLPGHTDMVLDVEARRPAKTAQTVQPDEVALLKAAQPVIKVDPDRQDVSWLSDHQLLISTTEHKPTLGDEAHNTWRGTLELYDTKTHEKTAWKELTDLVQRKTVYPMQEPYHFEMSPDGAWILWGTGGQIWLA